MEWESRVVVPTRDHVLIGSLRSLVTFVMVDNKLPYAFVQIILLQHSYCTLVTILLRPFARPVRQPGDVHESTFRQICIHPRT